MGRLFTHNFLYIFLINDFQKENCQTNSKGKKDPPLISSFLKAVSIHLLNVAMRLGESEEGSPAPDANFFNTENIYRAAKSSVVAAGLPITLTARRAAE